MVAIFVGVVFIGAGLWGMVTWFPDFLRVLRGFLPLAFVLGGFVTLITGLTSLQSNQSNVKIKKK